MLGQVHVDDGDAPIWDRPDDDSGLYALQIAAAVRDLEPEHFRRVHGGLFALRPEHGGDLRDHDAVHRMLGRARVDVTAMRASVDDGSALKVVRTEHENAARDHNVWGVPTFVVGDRAVFVRLMERPTGGRHAIRTVERVPDLIDGFVELNELKHTSISR